MFDAFALADGRLWTAEDGGRIRHRSATGMWSHQTVPDVVKDAILRVHFLPDGLKGWAVSRDGYLLRTANGGLSWIVLTRSDLLPGSQLQELWDVHFLDDQEGWLLGLHSMWHTANGGASWTQVTLLKQDGVTPYTSAELADLEFYALDIAFTPDPPILGMACAEPGLVFRMQIAPFNAGVWKEVFDIRTLCNTGALTGCENNLCPPPIGSDEHYEPWDIEINGNSDQKLAIMFGGVGFHCGMIWVSTDDGANWTKERHECVCPSPPCGAPYPCNPANDPLFLYNDDPTMSDDTWRWQYFETMYGGAIVDGSGTAAAVGYGGQTVIRDGTTGVWRDRSNYSNNPMGAPQSVQVPMKGAASPRGSASNTTVVLTGLGGYIRQNTSAWPNWQWETLKTTSDTVGQPWRISDVYFFNQNEGWMVSQFLRLARTVDGGSTWAEALPAAQLGTPKLLAITFGPAPFNANGVTVGQSHPTAGGPSQPKILYTTDGGMTAWNDGTYSVGSAYDYAELREVAWASGSDWWTAGSRGLILRSSDGGATWTQYLPEPFSSFQWAEFQGLAFANGTNGLFVGDRPDPNRIVRGVAYQYRDVGGTPTWTQISINDPGAPSGTYVKTLAGVHIRGNDAYAVGHREDVLGVGPRVGLLLKSTASGGIFGPFTVLHTTHECQFREELESRVSVLNRVQVASNGDVFAGGECGRVWQLVASTSQWIELKSQTSAHIRGMSFPSATVGYFAGHRQDVFGTSHALTRFKP